MRILIRFSVASIILFLLFLTPLSPVTADGPNDKSQRRAEGNSSVTPDGKNSDERVPEIGLLEASRQGLISAHAEGRGDGRMTVSVTNRTKHQLRVVLPPGLIAQGATGQFGGMGGMGGMMGGMGGGMGGMGVGMGGMGVGMGGMGGGMGGMGGMRGGMMGGMGGMGMSGGTMPSTMGMMMLARMIMYFCGDPDSWDMRSLMISMMGMRGGMGGMGGGMMGGMGGGMMGGMGGGMRSVPPSSLPSALLNPGQTRHLPTRLVILAPPDPQEGLKLPEKGEPLRLGDIADVNDNPRVQKALRRLAANAVSKSISRLIMWRLTAGVDWETLAELSNGWANGYELTLARNFVERLDTLPDGETGRVLFEVDGTDTSSAALAAQVKTALRRQTVLGLMAELGIPTRPEGPAVAFRVRMSPSEAQVLVTSSDATAQKWIPFGKFSLAVVQDQGKMDVGRFADGLAEGVLNRLVRVQLSKGVKDKGKMHYQLRIDNASPLVLNGLAAVGATSMPEDQPRVLTGISLPPRRSMTVPASEEVVKTLGLKKGIKLIALDLSGL
jgi:hypothetical protein